MYIQFDKLTDIVIVQEQKISVNSIEIPYFIDNMIEKKVIAYTIPFGNIIVWEGQDYENAGQYTENDIINRIKEILK